MRGKEQEMIRWKLVTSFIAVAVVLLASVVLADFTAYTETGDQVVVIDTIGGGSGGCTCTHVFDPVVCGEFPDKKYFSNACVAACNGYTDCAGVVLNLE